MTDDLAIRSSWAIWVGPLMASVPTSRHTDDRDAMERAGQRLEGCGRRPGVAWAARRWER